MTLKELARIEKENKEENESMRRVKKIQRKIVRTVPFS